MARARYTPYPAGLRAVGRSPGVQAAAMEGARKVRSFAAGDDPAGQYVSQPAMVPVGRMNEIRAGAVVTEAVRGDGARRRTLVRASEQSR